MERPFNIGRSRLRRHRGWGGDNGHDDDDEDDNLKDDSYEDVPPFGGKVDGSDENGKMATTRRWHRGWWRDV